MQENKDLYLPIFYSYLDLTKSLSDAEFGMLVRMLLTRLGSKGEPNVDALPENVKIAYGFMLDGAMRIIGRGAKKTNTTYTAASAEKPAPKRYGNFDPRAAFERALERTYGKKEPEQKSCSDP